MHFNDSNANDHVANGIHKNNLNTNTHKMQISNRLGVGYIVGLIV